MADIFDQIETAGGGDIFDQIEVSPVPVIPAKAGIQTPEGDIFDQIEEDSLPIGDWVKSQIKKTLKTAGVIGSQLVLATGAGIMGAAELLPRISTDPDKLIEPGSIDRAGKKFDEIMSFPAQEIIFSDEEAKALESTGKLVGWPFEKAGEGWRLIAKEVINPAVKAVTGHEIPYLEPALGTMGEAAAVFGAGGKAGKRILEKGRTALSAKNIEARGMAQEAKYGNVGVVPEQVAAAAPDVVIPLKPESQFLKDEFTGRFVEEPVNKEAPPATEAAIQPESPAAMPGTLPGEPGVTLYGGLPLGEFARQIGEGWTKYIGEPVWDTFVMNKVPKFLEKIPGGKAVNRALIYGYKGDLPGATEYMTSFEDMRRFQASGREYAIDLGQRLQQLPEPRQMAVGEFIRGERGEGLAKNELALADEANWAFLELGKQAVDLGLLNEETFFKNAGRYMPRLYTEKEFQGNLTRFGLSKPNRLDLSRFQKRKDIPKEIRTEMGEILTPGYPVAKGITQLTHDIEMGKFFRGIAERPEWSWKGRTFEVLAADPEAKSWGVWEGDQVRGVFSSRKEAYAARQQMMDEWNSQNPVPEGFQQLPKNPKLGDLSEAYVHPEIYNDLMDAVRISSAGEKAWRTALGAWKFGKVILSPKTHIRNMVSNSILAHLGGMPMYEQFVYLPRAAMELRGKGDIWMQAKKAGLLADTFTNQELRVLFDQVQNQMAGTGGSAGLVGDLGRVAQGWDQVKGTLNKAAKLYEAEEQWFKLAKFMHNMERKGMDATAAAADAEKWLFNYSKLTRFQDKYRTSPLGAPFATFTFKAIPRIAEAAVKTPWRFALPAAMIMGLEEWARQEIGDTREQEKSKKAIRPEYMHTNLPGTFPRVPVVDDYGREHYLNLTYLLPWGDIAEGGGFGPIPGALMPFSQPGIKEAWEQAANYDLFTKKPMVSSEELAGKGTLEKLGTEATIRMKHAGASIAPTPVMDIAKAVSAIRNDPDYRGRERKFSVVLADAILGLKMYPVDYAEQASRIIRELDPEKGNDAQKLWMQMKTLDMKKAAVEKKGEDGSRFQAEINAKKEQILGLAAELKEKGKTIQEAVKK